MLRWFGPGEPQVGGAVDVPDPNQPQVLGSIACGLKPVMDSLTGVFWGALGKGFSYNLLVHHTHDGTVRTWRPKLVSYRGV